MVYSICIVIKYNICQIILSEILAHLNYMRRFYTCFEEASEGGGGGELLYSTFGGGGFPVVCGGVCGVAQNITEFWTRL